MSRTNPSPQTLHGYACIPAAAPPGTRLLQHRNGKGPVPEAGASIPPLPGGSTLFCGHSRPAGLPHIPSPCGFSPPQRRDIPRPGTRCPVPHPSRAANSFLKWNTPPHAGRRRPPAPRISPPIPYGAPPYSGRDSSNCETGANERRWSGQGPCLRRASMWAFVPYPLCFAKPYSG